MKTAPVFSLLLFAPLMAALLLPAMCLAPAGILMALIGLADPTIPLSDIAAYGLWVCGPIAAAAGLFAIGVWLAAARQRRRSRLFPWIAAWAVYSIGLFAAAWLGLIMVTSIGASDFPADAFERWTAGIAVVVTVAFQPAIGVWLFAVSRMWRHLTLR
jgi:hypothetical protein